MTLFRLIVMVLSLGLLYISPQVFVLYRDQVLIWELVLIMVMVLLTLLWIPVGYLKRCLMTKHGKIVLMVGDIIVALLWWVPTVSLWLPATLNKVDPQKDPHFMAWMILVRALSTSNAATNSAIFITRGALVVWNGHTNAVNMTEEEVSSKWVQLEKENERIKRQIKWDEYEIKQAKDKEAHWEKTRQASD